MESLQTVGCRLRFFEPEPFLRNSRDRLAVLFNLVLMINEVAVRMHIGAALNFDLEPVANTDERFSNSRCSLRTSIVMMSRTVSFRAWILLPPRPRHPAGTKLWRILIALPATSNARVPRIRVWQVGVVDTLCSSITKWQASFTSSTV